MLDFCTGRGRNAAALQSAGFAVIAVPDEEADRFDPFGERGAFAAVLTTHGLLHGTPKTIAARLDRLRFCLADDGELYAAFGSTRDARYGKGRRIGAATFVPAQGDERGVAHTYFTRERLENLLRVRFTVERLWESGVDSVAGSWAHPTQPLANAVHWFAVARASTTSASGLDALA